MPCTRAGHATSYSRTRSSGGAEKTLDALTERITPSPGGAAPGEGSVVFRDRIKNHACIDRPGPPGQRMNATALAAAADCIEAAAFRDMIAAAPQDFARAVGLRSATAAGATLLIAPGIPNIQFTTPIALAIAPPSRQGKCDS